MSVIKFENVTKKYGKNLILDNVSFSINKCGIYGIIGNNGCGKTTTMKLILGLIKKNSGNIYIYDQKVKFGNTKTNTYIGYLCDVPTFYQFMDAHEYLKFCAQMLKIPKLDYNRRIKTLIKLVGLEKYATTKISGYSRGMKQRLGIAQALLSNPKILICDEPTSALDVNGRSEILSLLKTIGEKIVVIFSTHILTDVERICDYVAIMKDQQLTKFEKINSLKQKYFTNKFVISFTQENELLKFRELTNWKHTQVEDQVNLIIWDDKINTYFKNGLKIIASNQIDINGMYKLEVTLEEIFLEEIKNV